MTQVTVLVVDDELAIRQVLADLLTADPRVDCVGAVATVQNALDLARRTRPDVALMDVRMPGGGPDAVAAMRIVSPATRVVALSGAADGAIVRAMLEAGASGYLLKGTLAGELIDAVVRSASGDTVLAAEVAAAATALPR
jgi:DNA-binding NarL/FixJ family response regulator